MSQHPALFYYVIVTSCVLYNLSSPFVLVNLSPGAENGERRRSAYSACVYVTYTHGDSRHRSCIRGQTLGAMQFSTDMNEETNIPSDIMYMLLQDRVSAKFSYKSYACLLSHLWVLFFLFFSNEPYIKRWMELDST